MYNGKLLVLVMTCFQYTVHNTIIKLFVIGVSFVKYLSKSEITGIFYFIGIKERVILFLKHMFFGV